MDYMSFKIADTKIIQEFMSGEVVRGVYSLKFNGGLEVFVRCGNKVYVINHSFDVPKVYEVRDAVSKTFIDMLSTLDKEVSE